MKTITKPIIIYVDALRRDLLIASVIQALLKKEVLFHFLFQEIPTNHVLNLLNHLYTLL